MSAWGRNRRLRPGAALSNLCPQLPQIPAMQMIDGYNGASCQ